MVGVMGCYGEIIMDNEDVRRFGGIRAADVVSKHSDAL
jgi:allophanate hydrolase subunit 1